MSLAGKRVLLVGDSHTVGTYGSALEAMLKAAGATVQRIAHVGARAADYLGKGKYAAELARAKGPFDIAIVSLGTNDAAFLPTNRDKLAGQMQAILAASKAPTTWWVGAPSFHPKAASTYNAAFAKWNLTDRAKVVWDNVSRVFGDRAIDARDPTLAFVNPKDIHLGTSGGRAWAKHVFQSITGGGGGSIVAPTTSDSPGISPTTIAVGVAAVAVLAFFVLRRRKS
jgi:hypothetical protein